MHAENYQLIDFGEGRKLERLGNYRIDRPSPAAERQRRHQSVWRDVDAQFDAVSKRWTFHRPWPAHAEVDCGAFRMPVQPTPFGHIGIFPEQQSNWAWLHDCAIGHGQRFGQPLQALNLFAYTGASSLAVATAGGQVAHVDAAKPNVVAAKRAASAAACDGSIRFLTDDASKFVAREIRRKRCYNLIILDPPAYGHGPSGKAWRLERDLWPLLRACLELLSPHRHRSPHAHHLLLTGHSEQIGSRDVVQWLRQHSAPADHLVSGRSQLIDTANRKLDCGFVVRASWQPQREA